MGMTAPGPVGTVSVTINHNAATKRTRNRVKEGGPSFEFFDNTNRPDSILLRSPKTGWFGWLPKSEVTLENYGLYNNLINNNERQTTK
jgi:hypothetical protein